jgi:hypothetical protein
MIRTGHTVFDRVHSDFNKAGEGDNPETEIKRENTLLLNNIPHRKPGSKMGPGYRKSKNSEHKDDT